jgi:hypothetical protein
MRVAVKSNHCFPKFVEDAENAEQLSKIVRNFSTADGFYDSGKVS